jgi:hypothetical protein
VSPPPLPLAHTTVQPSWIRLPRTGRCPFCGLTRSSLYALITGSNPPVRSIVLRRPGKHHGIRLIDFDSLNRHFESQTDNRTKAPSRSSAKSAQDSTNRR